MEKQAFNPYLPSYEYIPDGEPYVFGDRLYVYGSHDKFDGQAYCLNDYVCWSAPITDLADWRYEGVIYKKTQDPLNADGGRILEAPDMQKGPDGRCYLFYAMKGTMSVAVCDTPAGQYQYYGSIKYPDGKIAGGKAGEIFQFDPGVLVDDDGKVYLYSGFAPRPDRSSAYREKKLGIEGAYFMELEQDMLTLKRGPTVILPGIERSEGTGYEGHEFFEASSMRKVGSKYYFIYSSTWGHELCYAVSNKPDKDFFYGGTLISNGDIYLDGRKEPLNYIGNNHGSIVEINGQWYVFYHRQTNRHQFSRQGCAEPIVINADGSIHQVEMTSCGLNGKPLSGKGEYEARIACNLMSKEGAAYYWTDKQMLSSIHPYFTQDGADREENGNQYIANFQNGAMAGFKYFVFEDTASVAVKIRGDAEGIVAVSFLRDGAPAAEIKVHAASDWKEFSAPLHGGNGKQALYFTFLGKGAFDFMSFRLD
jgi:hypothetical protein